MTSPAGVPSPSPRPALCAVPLAVVTAPDRLVCVPSTTPARGRRQPTTHCLRRCWSSRPASTRARRALSVPSACWKRLMSNSPSSNKPVSSTAGVRRRPTTTSPLSQHWTAHRLAGCVRGHGKRTAATSPIHHTTSPAAVSTHQHGGQRVVDRHAQAHHQGSGQGGREGGCRGGRVKGVGQHTMREREGKVCCVCEEGAVCERRGLGLLCTGSVVLYCYLFMLVVIHCVFKF
mmetsp:Transcript_24773/g.61218  ORF Transcript_24773/g.61218 Transcript_24773/m.61218 type:complete len:232 (+) Transcript_24773:829-1524(+)